jgi:hypothetical protein
MEKIVYKLLLNSLYGKFAESPEKQALLINPPKIDSEKMRLYFPGAWLATTEVPIPHEHVAIAAHITAIARRSLYEWLTLCEPDYYYCDTDGFAVDANLDVGPNLGELKLEKRLKEARFQAPKVYRYMDETGKEVIKAKGFSEMNREKFDRLLDGEVIEFQRMARLKELYGGITHSPEPIEILIKKVLRGIALSKRFTYPDGSTRPWHIEELHSGNTYVPLYAD